MSSESPLHPLARLEQILERCAAEYAELERDHPALARHLAVATGDLQMPIAGLRRESVPVPVPTHPDFTGSSADGFDEFDAEPGLDAFRSEVV